MKNRALKRRPTVNAKRRARNPLRVDPSRTAGLRKAFAADLKRRFARLRLRVADLVGREDAFGLGPRPGVFNFDPGQPRDDHGRWTAGGAGGERHSLYEAVKEKGGFTSRPVDGTSPTKGFAVATVRGAEKTFDLDKLTPDDIYDYIAEHADRFKDRRVHVGGWVDKGKVYLDLSTVVDNKDEAIDLGVKNDQLAVFDLEKFETVEVPGRRTREAKDGGQAGAANQSARGPHRGGPGTRRGQPLPQTHRPGAHPGGRGAPPAQGRGRPPLTLHHLPGQHEQESHGQRGGAGGGGDFASFREKALANLTKSSRTSKGVSDVSSSKDKPKLDVEGRALADRVRSNTEAALETVWRNRKADLDSAGALRLVERVGRQVSEGLSAAPLYRRHETKFARQTRAGDVEEQTRRFAAEYAARLDDPDPVATAAWVEYEFDGRIHPFTDGVGRSTKLLSALVLARHGRDLPAYRDRETYYAKINGSLEEFTRYYRTLFGGPAGNARLAANQRWRFLTSPEKVAAFQQWLKTQVALEFGEPNRRLWERYVEAGFRKGAGRAFDDTKRAQRVRSTAEGTEALASYRGGREQFLRSAFGRPVAVEKVKLLAGRVYDDLEGVTAQMSAKMARTLADGLVQGKGPDDVARDLAADVDGIGSARAQLIARTEIIRAHAEGQLTALEDLGVEDVGVAVEWQVTPDERLCPACAVMDGVVLKIDEARGMIPRHPNCRCAWVPANVGEGGPGRPTENVRHGAWYNKRAAGRPPLANFDPDQPRDESGRWTATGGGAGQAPDASRVVRSPRTRAPRAEFPRTPERGVGGVGLPTGEQPPAQQPDARARARAAEEAAGRELPKVSFRRRSTIERLRDGEVSNVQYQGGGVNTTQRITVTDTDDVADADTTALFKPASGEADGMRDYIEGGTYYRREVAAARVAEVLGLERLVPAVAVREVNGQVGAVQEWVPGTVAEAHGEPFDGEEDATAVAAFDYLIGNTDRHPGNWVVTDDDRIRLIDHGLSLPTGNQDDMFDWSHGRFIWERASATVPGYVKDWGRRWPELEKQLRAHAIEDDAVAAAKERLDDLVGAAGKKKFRQLRFLAGSHFGFGVTPASEGWSEVSGG